MLPVIRRRRTTAVVPSSWRRWMSPSEILLVVLLLLLAMLVVMAAIRSYASTILLRLWLQGCGCPPCRSSSSCSILRRRSSPVFPLRLCIVAAIRLEAVSHG